MLKRAEIFSPLFEERFVMETKLKGFLTKYDTVIFDMDGVITSEQAYWDAAALTVYQQMNAKALFDDEVDVNYYMENLKKIRKEVFLDDKLIQLLKDKGVNSNWDLAYVTFSIATILETKDFSKVLDYVLNMSNDIFKEYENISKKLKEKLKITDASRTSKLWNDLMMRFQEWVLGDELFFRVYGYEVSQKGKVGILVGEKPVVDREGIKKILKALKNQGKRLCTATGRIWEELETPLKNFEIFEYFANDGFINFNHVTNVQNKFEVQVTKPHPYMFQKALLGEEYPDNDILRENFDKNLIKTALVVGDAGADILAAKKMGADFCAVLTGVKGKAARGYFEKFNAEYILDSILEFEGK